MLALGTTLPNFALTNAVNGATVSSQELGSPPAILVMFICNHCPFVVHVQAEIEALAREYLPQGVKMLAINSNSVQTHPQDGPVFMKQLAEARGWEFPFLLDESQEVAKNFRAACTPDFFLFDGAHQLVYRGQLDDSRPGNGKPVTGADLRAALTALLHGAPVATTQIPSIGCNIKWAPGHAPSYAR